MRRFILCMAALAASCIVQAKPEDREVRHDVPLDSIQLSDPAILADQKTKMYYMTGTGGMMWRSNDLWIQESEPITPPNCGHSMLFQRFDGKWMMSIHSHAYDAQGRTIRIPHLFEVDISGDKLIVRDGRQAIPTQPHP